MKNWIATYTDDYGQTEKTMPVQAETYTQAYYTVDLKIYKSNGIILELNEVKGE